MSDKFLEVLKGLDASALPERPWDVCPAGSLIIAKMYTIERPTGELVPPLLVLETKRHFGNPNGDNTADHWYWTYVVYEEDGDHVEVEARYYKEFIA